MHTQTAQRFSDRLADSIRRAGAPVCVGLDPVLERLPEGATGETPECRIVHFCRSVIDAVAPFACAIKPQSACFERYGAGGMGVLADTITHANELDLPVVLDAKRGDIGISASHYAAGAVRLGAHSITLNPYLGPSTIEPFLDAGLGAFVLVRTSNPDADRLQSMQLHDGPTVSESVAEMVAELGASRIGASGLSDVGAVVGLTKSADGARLRERMPDQVFLVPGYGAQGGGADDLAPLLTQDASRPGRGVLVTASRSVIYAGPGTGEHWADAVGEAAERFRDDVGEAIQGG